MSPTIHGRPLTPPRIEIPTTSAQIGLAIDLAQACGVPMETMLAEIMRLKLIICVEQVR